MEKVINNNFLITLIVSSTYIYYVLYYNNLYTKKSYLFKKIIKFQFRSILEGDKI